MQLFFVVSMVIFLISQSSGDNQLSPSPPIQELPKVEQCRRALQQPQQQQQQQSHQSLIRLSNIVGVGWDNLRNVPNGPVFRTTFDQCKTTPDSTFLLPDQVSALPVQTSRIDRVAEYYENYHEYFESTTETINLAAGVTFGSGSISGKYSRQHTESKRQSISRRTAIFRSRIHYDAYTLIGSMDAEFQPTFKNRLLDIGGAIAANDSCMAKLLSRLLIRDYGTHVITKADVGVEISQDDYVDVNAMQTKQISIDDMKASASLSFLNISLNISTGRSVTKESMDAFQSTVTHTQLNTQGGPDINRLIASKNNNYDLSINDIVALDRSGEPLFYIIKPRNLPELRAEIVWAVSGYLKNATKEYYIHNTHYGCTDPTAENFDINANIDDGTCRQPFNNYTFGGLYQTCSSAYPNDYICSQANQPNGITGQYSCPPLYSPVLLLDITQPVEYKCVYKTGSWFGPKHVWYTCYRHLRSYWCKATTPSSVPANSGYMFGGTYTSTRVNPYTGSASCPGRYVGVRFAFDVTFCLSRDYELDHRYSVRLGHLFSCLSSSPKDSNEQRCPVGYSQHLATISDGCEVYYCVRPEKDDETKMVVVHRPPYGHYLFRDSYIAQKPTDGLGGGAIAAIVLAIVVVVLVAILASGFVYWRKSKPIAKNNKMNNYANLQQETESVESSGMLTTIPTNGLSYQAIEENA